MFGTSPKENKRELEAAINSNNSIANGTVVSGDIETTGNLRIEGRVVGNIRSKAKVFVGDTGQVTGHIFSQGAEVEGKIEGNLEVSDKLVLRATAVVEGDILASKLIVEDGATWRGRCQVGKPVNGKIVPETPSSNGQARPEKQPQKVG